MKHILRYLDGGDRRSIRGVPEVVHLVLGEPSLFSAVFDGILGVEPVNRMRCADAIEKITRARPEYLQPYKKQLLQLAVTEEQPEVRWHLAQLVPRLHLSKRERRQAVEVLNRYLTDRSRIVKTFAMQGLADIAARDPLLRGPILERLRELTRIGSPAMRSRGRKLLAQLDEPPGGQKRLQS